MSGQLTRHAAWGFWMLLAAGLARPGTTQDAGQGAGRDGADGGAQQQSVPGHHSVRGEVLEVVSPDIVDEATLVEALALAERAWPVVARRLGVKKREHGHQDGTPLRLYLYGNANDYEVAERERTGGQFLRNRAFSFRSDLTSHLVFEPLWSPSTRQRLGLPMHMQRLIVHEATHLLVYASCKGRGAFHPNWFAEGLAQSVEAEVMRDLGLVRDPSDSPRDAEHMVNALGVAKRGELPSVQQILSEDLGDLEFYSRYAMWQMLFQLLDAQHGRALGQVLREIPERRGTPRLGADLGDALLDRIGRAKARRLDEELAQAVAGLEPKWHQPLRSLARLPEERKGKGAAGWVHASLGTANAVVFRRQPMESASYVLRFSGELIENTIAGEKPQLNVLLDEQAEGFVSVALRGDGSVTVLEYTREGSNWERLGSARAPLATGVPFAVAVAVADGVLTVSVDDKSVLEVRRPQRAWVGSWGLGAQQGTVGLWTSLPE